MTKKGKRHLQNSYKHVLQRMRKQSCSGLFIIAPVHRRHAFKAVKCLYNQNYLCIIWAKYILLIACQLLYLQGSYTNRCLHQYLATTSSLLSSIPFNPFEIKAYIIAYYKTIVLF